MYPDFFFSMSQSTISSTAASLCGDERAVVLHVLEVGLVHQGRFVDVVVGGDAVIVRDLGQLADIVHVVAADVDVEEDP